MEKFRKAKEASNDAILLFKMGDFYEVFFEDVEVCAKVLGLTKTTRDKDGKIPMAGFPFYFVDSYLAKLIKAGHRVAVCEDATSLENPVIQQ